MRLFDVQYQWSAQQRLQQALSSGRMPHAWLFAGPEGVGREMLAVRIARILLCERAGPVAPPDEAPPGARGLAWRDACGTCDDCVLMEAGTHPDFHRVYRELHRFHPDPLIRQRKGIKLSIDVIRHFLLEPIGLRPFRGRAKVFVIPEAERLSTDAQNALLKTLEEPPPDSYMFLLSRTASGLLATTQSRCQLVTFGGLGIEYVARLLVEQTQMAESDARFLAAMSGGSPGTAIRLGALDVAEQRTEVWKILLSVRSDPLAAAKNLSDMADQLTKLMKPEDESGRGSRRTSRTSGESEVEPQVSDEVGADDEEDEEDEESTKASSRRPDAALARAARLDVLTIIATLCRDVLRAACDTTPVGCVDSERDNDPLRRLAAGLGTTGAWRAIRAVSAAEAALEQNAHPLLVFERLMIEIARGFGGTIRAA